MSDQPVVEAPIDPDNDTPEDYENALAGDETDVAVAKNQDPIPLEDDEELS